MQSSRICCESFAPRSMEVPSILNLAESSDLERNDSGHFLMNQTVQSLSWHNLTVTVKDRETKRARDLINTITGDVKSGMYARLYSRKKAFVTEVCLQGSWSP